VELGDALPDALFKHLARVSETAHVPALPLGPGLGDGPYNVVNLAVLRSTDELEILDEIQVSYHLRTSSTRDGVWQTFASFITSRSHSKCE
jgi:hypothetical protein